MWLRLRKTARRGRSTVPVNRRRIRSWRLRRAAPRLPTCVIVFVPLSAWLLLAADLAGLAGLAADLLPGVPDALALVRLGLACGADLGRDLAHELLVDPDHGQPGGVLELEADPLRRRDLDRMAVAEAQLQPIADLLGAIADTGDLEALAVAVRDALDHVRDEGPCQAVELLVDLLLARPLHEERAVLLADRDVRVKLTAELAFRALDRHLPAVDRDVDAARDGDGKSTDS